AWRAARSIRRAEWRQGLAFARLIALRHRRLLIPFGRTLFECLRTNPAAAKAVVTVTALYLHVGPYSRVVIGELRQKIDAIEHGDWRRPPLIPPPANAPVEVRREREAGVG
ncbi:MAG: hypothetical protein KGL38_09330, partial [Gemmatimonadota bacterium]|nr:hypothetical protein [Gemmatimonadota bacterium]